MRYITCIILLIPLFFVFGAPDPAPESLNLHLLRAKSTGQVIEYDFKEDGKLFAYIYTTDDSESGPTFPSEQLTPRFQVFVYKWRLAGQNLFLMNGRKEMKVDYADWHRSGDVVQFNELTFHKVDQLEFFDNLHAYTGNNYTEAKAKK